MESWQASRPRATDIAVKLLYLALVVSAVRAVFLEWSVLQTSHPIVNTCFSVFFLGITLWLILMIGKGRNWARTVYLIWFVISLPVFAVDISELAADSVKASLGMLSTIISLAALVLLFQKASSDWFRVMKKTDKLAQTEIA